MVVLSQSPAFPLASTLHDVCVSPQLISWVVHPHALVHFAWVTCCIGMSRSCASSLDGALGGDGQMGPDMLRHIRHIAVLTVSEHLVPSLAVSALHAHTRNL